MPKKVKKITRLGLLLALREGYLFCRNLLGLIFHPFRTIRIIYEEKDLSQAALIFGFPFYLFILGFIGIKGTRFLIGAPQSPWGPLAKLGGLLLLLGTLICILYLFYWLWQVVKSQKIKLKSQKWI